MRLTALLYSEFEKDPREWKIRDLVLHSVNLIVGKNATGKTRTLNVIASIAKILSGRQKPDLTSGNWEAIFSDKDQVLRYQLRITENKIVHEEFKRGNDILLRRGVGGIGFILHEKEGRYLEFQTPESDVAAVSRIDNIQHTFLQPLREWGEGVRYYMFGESLGRNIITFVVNGGPPPDPNNANAAVALYRKGAKDHPGQFERSILEDMNAIGYDITEIGVMTPTDITIQGPHSNQVSPITLYAQERDLSCKTQQMHMSHGMFQALAMIIHVNYAAIASRPNAVIIDDIGQGLDFDRSCRLIEVLRKKTQKSSVQLIMSTNDRFIMNRVPLEEWSLLQRKGGEVTVRNYGNSKPIFDEFKFTGLNNFDFLATNFINELLEQEQMSP